jgi:hypothetical protein
MAKPTLPAEVRAALVKAGDFAETEAENRGYAGSDMTDYQDEAQQLVDAIDAILNKYAADDD